MHIFIPFLQIFARVGTVKRGDLDLQGDYDNAPSDFDRVYYRAVQILLITNYATLVLTCTVHVICI